jgi:hypothetical protein
MLAAERKGPERQKAAAATNDAGSDRAWRRARR